LSSSKTTPDFLDFDTKLKVESIDGKTVVGDSAEALYEYLLENNLSDGLPVIPPTQERVRKMLRFTDREPSETIMGLGAANAPLTVEKLAINAVMAGCKPEYLPILITAFEIMKDPDYNVTGSALTRNNCAQLVLASGPLTQEIGMNGGLGCMGPGFRANATIGRTINLALITVGWVVPGKVTRAYFSSPERYSLCFCEDLAGYPAPWKPVNEELFNSETTTVTCQVSASPQMIEIGSVPNMPPQHVLTQISSAITGAWTANMTTPSTVVVVLNKDLAKIITDAGWSKEDVRLFLYDHSRNPVDAAEKVWPRMFQEHLRRVQPWARYAWGGRYPAIPHPKHIGVVVAGGPGTVQAAAVIRGASYGPNVKLISRPVAFKDGSPIKSMKDFSK
jgi:hypothetical protein